MNSPIANATEKNTQLNSQAAMRQKKRLLKMRLTTLHTRPKIYRMIQIVLVGPLVVLWGGVAYWFGFGSEAILKTVFPPLMAPVLLTATIASALLWTMLHLKNTPTAKQVSWRVDIFLCLFILFSMLVVVGQMMRV